MIQHSMVLPMREYCTIFPTCLQHVKAREKALQEYSKVQAKLERQEERERTAGNMVRIEMVINSILVGKLLCLMLNVRLLFSREAELAAFAAGSDFSNKLI